MVRRGGYSGPAKPFRGGSAKREVIAMESDLQAEKAREAIPQLNAAPKGVTGKTTAEMDFKKCCNQMVVNAAGAKVFCGEPIVEGEMEIRGKIREASTYRRCSIHLKR